MLPNKDLLYFSFKKVIFSSTIHTTSGLPIINTIKEDCSAGYRGVAYSPDESGNAKVYWIDDKTKTISKINIDGSDEQIIVSGLSNATFLDIHVPSGLVIWADKGLGAIKRCNLDGSNIVTILSGGSIQPCGIAVNDILNHIYWTDFSAGTIRRIGLDGSNNILIKLVGVPFDILIDKLKGKMYWTDFLNKWVKRSDLNGANEELVSLNNEEFVAIALDNKREVLYKMEFGELPIFSIGVDLLPSPTIVFIPKHTVEDSCENNTDSFSF